MLRSVMTFVRRTLSPLKRAFGPQIRLAKYRDYETYRQTQQAGNEKKLQSVWAREGNIQFIAQYARDHIADVRSVLCHGTRNGAEIRWFKAALGGAPRVLGTDISTTATQFPDTIVWDFHEFKPEWEGAWDLVYSNSWDHAHDPQLAFRHWMRSLSPGGMLFLEHSRRHEPWAISSLDPFGATIKGLSGVLNSVDPRFHVSNVLPLPDGERKLIVVSRKAL